MLRTTSGLLDPRTVLIRSPYGVCLSVNQRLGFSEPVPNQFQTSSKHIARFDASAPIYLEPYGTILRTGFNRSQAQRKPANAPCTCAHGVVARSLPTEGLIVYDRASSVAVMRLTAPN